MISQRGGKREGAGRPPVDPAKKRHTRPVALNDNAWERICDRAAYTGRTTNDVIQRWAERLPVLG